MNTRTGKLFNASEEDLEEILGLNEDLVKVDPKDMTQKQKKEMKVNLKDTRSKLGKLRLEERKKVFGK